jgi:GTP:adenosylcobinamide-phosphate guanylyltransferase
MTALTALVLAGTRAGGDPLADYAGVSHKALIEVGGRTMVERVVEALAASPEVERIVVAIEQPALLDGLAGLAPPRCTRPLQTVPSEPGGPSATVAAALRSLGTPLLVTTADNALLESAWIAEFLAKVPADADLAAALARRDAVEAAAPDTRRTWLRFADGDHSGCNLFLLATPAAARAIAFWRTIEGERKHPIRMVRRLGWTFALRYALGRLPMAAAAARLGALSGGVRFSIVALSDGRAAIDVDKPDDLDLVRRLVSPSPARGRGRG